jgi:hypothetical protein
LIAGKHGDHKSIGIGNNSDPQSAIAFMTFDMHRFVGDTYDDDNGDDGEDDANRIDDNDIDTLYDDDDDDGGLWFCWKHLFRMQRRCNEI